MDRQDKLKASLVRRGWFPLVVLAFGVVLTAALAVQLQVSIEDDARDEFEIQAEQAANAIAARIRAYTEALYAVRALFHSSTRVTQGAFRVFVENLELGTRYPALSNLNYAAYVREEEKKALVTEIRADKSGGSAAMAFDIRPSDPRREHYVITHIAPLEGNERSFGLDIGAPPAKPDALEYGRDTGRLISSGRIIRFENGIDHIAMRMAVYRAGAPTETVEQRREAYIGSVGTGFRLAELMRGVLEEQNLQHIRFRVIDIDRAGGGLSLVFDNAVALEGPGRRYTTRRQTEMGGRLWELDFSAAERSLVTAHNRTFPWLVLAGGLLASLLLASVVFLIASSRHRALVLARRMNRELHLQEMRLAESQRMARLGSWEISGPKRQMLWSDELYRILGAEPRPGRMTLDDFVEAVHPADRQKVRNMLRLSSEAGSVLELEHRLRLRDGSERWVLTKAKLEEQISEGGVWRGTTMDITERKRAEFKLQIEHEATRILGAGGPKDSVLLEMLRLLCARLNMVCAVHWQLDGEHGLRCQRVWCTDKVDRSDRVHVQMESSGSPLARLAVRSRGVVIAADAGMAAAPIHPRSAGAGAMHRAVAFPVIGANIVLGVVELFSEAPGPVEAWLAELLCSIGAQLGQYHQKALTDEALQLVPAHDSLTGIANRIELQNRLALALSRARRARRAVALLIVDLDRFKLVNAGAGHAAGDRLLQECARRLSQALRQSDAVGRLGGDQFAVVLEGLDNARDIAPAVTRIQEALGKPLFVGGRELRASATLGVSVYPSDGIDAASLLKHANRALQQAKQQARGAYRFFSASMNDEIESRTLRAASLRGALERGELALYYQPRVSVRTGRIIALEALLRWQHPQCGMVPPLEFLPFAEETGLIVPIGAWVLNEACERARSWRDSGLVDLRVAVNLSAPQFAADTLTDEIARALSATGLPPEALELEVAEALVMRAPAQAAQTLHELKRMGIALSIGEFGAGESSLACLKMFPFAALKLNRSLIAGIPADSGDVAMTEALVHLAHKLGMRAVAEGVETEEQMHCLAKLGCEEMQGFFVSKPLPHEAVKPLLRRASP